MFSDKIMLIESDSGLAELFSEAIAQRFDAKLTCVESAELALEADLFEPQDLFVTRVELPGLDGLELARILLNVQRRPVLLITDEPNLEHAVEAVRIGATDYLAKPFEMAHLLNQIEHALQAHRDHRHLQKRAHQLRDLVRRVIRQRRDLDDRIDLICRDLVSAQRRLMTRVFEKVR